MAKNVRFIQKRFRKSVDTYKLMMFRKHLQFSKSISDIFYIFGVRKRNLFQTLMHYHGQLILFIFKQIPPPPQEKKTKKQMTQVKWCDRKKYSVKFGLTNRSINFSPRLRLSPTIFKHCFFLW